MKKLLLATVLLGTAASMSAQSLTLVKPKFGDNWTIGIDGGATTLLNNAPFFGSMRGIVGLHVQKQIVPAFGLGLEAQWGVNTSSWGGPKPRNFGIHSLTAFDSQYVGMYGAVNLWDLFLPYGAQTNRVFDMEVMAGAGWGHTYYDKASGLHDDNNFSTKVGLNLNFHPTERVTIGIRPSVTWAMTGSNSKNSSAYYNGDQGAFSIMASVAVRLGGGFKYVEPNYNLDELAALNAQVNAMRGDLDAAALALAESQAANQALANELAACKNQAPTIVKETKDFLSTVRYVNFALGKSVVPADQLPNVAAVAAYLKNHPTTNVVIKGYASADGPIDINTRLANQRAEAVKNMLINKYGIAAHRISAEGQGVGHMFEEESWNRVAICTLDSNAPVSTNTTVTK